MRRWCCRQKKQRFYISSTCLFKINSADKREVAEYSMMIIHRTINIMTYERQKVMVGYLNITPDVQRRLTYLLGPEDGRLGAASSRAGHLGNAVQPNHLRSRSHKE